MRPVAGIVILAEFFQAWNIEKFLEQHWEDIWKVDLFGMLHVGLVVWKTLM